MEGENEKVIKGADAAGGEELTPLFSVFRPKPHPAPAKAEASPPKPAPAPQAKPAVPPMDARLAELEKKLQEAAERENARGPEKQMLDYLKVKTAELEEKLRDSQKKALEFAYELKGREESRKESRREMEEFLGAVKQQQSAAEAERFRAMELEKSRQRIEALEQRLLEISSRPPPPADAGLAARIEELAGKIESVSARLDAAAKAGVPPEEAEKLRALFKKDAAGVFGPLVGEMSAVSVRLAAAAKAGLPPEEAEKLRALFKKDIAEAFPPLVMGISSLSASDAGLSARIEELTGKIGSVSARLDAAVKAGVPPEEAEKLRALFKKDIAEAFGPLVTEISAVSASAAGLAARVEIFAGEILSVSASESGLAARITGLAGKIESVSVRLDAAAKAGLPPEEAAKLRALFKEDVAEMFAPLLSEPESRPPDAGNGPGARRDGK